MYLATGGLRPSECFGIEVSMVLCILPRQGIYYGLPAGVGFVAINFGEETKSNMVSRSDLILSHYTASGFSPGRWTRRLLTFEAYDDRHLFSTERHPRWSSAIFRYEYAYPYLENMRIQGEPTLAAFNDTPGRRIRDSIWSCNSWRRFLTAFLKRYHPGLNQRKATQDEIYIHQRWEHKKNHKSEAMDIHYLEFNLEERISVTYFCV
jgi:hypothetical protein